MKLQESDLLNYIDLAERSNRIISFRTYALSEYGNWLLNRLTFEILRRIGRADLCEIIFVAIKELIDIFTKANLKKILLQESYISRDVNVDKEWLKENWDQLNLGDLGKYLPEVRKNELPVSVSFSFSKPDVLSVKVKHKFTMSSIEDDQLRNRFKHSDDYASSVSFFSTEENVEEDTFALTFVHFLLTGCGLDSRLLRIYSNTEQNETIARLEIPLAEQFESKRKRFEREYSDCSLEKNQFRKQFKNTSVQYEAAESQNELHSLRTEVACLQEENSKLQKDVKAWETVFDIGQNELLAADQTIKAQETALDLSQDELKALHTDIDKMVKIETLFETELMGILSREHSSSDTLLEELESLRDENVGRYCMDLIRVIMHINLEADEAQEHWDNILSHRKLLSEQLGRNLDFRVAMMDYFTNIKKMCLSPKTMEMTDFAELIRHTVVDELTGLYNRRFLTRTVEREIVRARRNGRSLSIVVCDIDKFKQVNDLFGHPAADQVLVQVAEILQNQSRTEDAACRFGGEEFILIVPEMQTEHAFHIAEKIRKTIEMHDFPVDRAITMSFGIASYPANGDNFKDILVAADKALYKAKNDGRNRTIMFKSA